VTTTADAGAGSFRQAILDANATVEPNTIAFDIGGGGVQTIQPLSALPVVTRPVVIDGTTQPGFAGTPLIVLNGSSAGFPANGLTISAGDSTVRGLVINAFSNYGITLQTNGGNLIAGNYIGTDVTGTQAVGNAVGLGVFGGSNNIIGGTTATDRNVMSGNRLDGVSAESANVLVQGNFIGTDVTGTLALGNRTGVIAGSLTRIGGTASGAGNVISGNREDGILAEGCVVQGNLIGTDVTGTRALGNLGNGVRAFSLSTIGGTVAGARNVISGNQGDGILIARPSVTGTRVEGNYIGTDVTGTHALGNLGNGVTLSSAGRDNTIGGTDAGAGNVISGNAYYGVQIFLSNGNRVQGNYIGTNATGTAAVRNLYGVYITTFAQDNTIGGTAAGAGNVISGNLNGVVIFNSDGNRVEGNSIGTDATGTQAVGNVEGVVIQSGSNNLIGGTAAGARNLISGNADYGVQLFGNASLVQGNYIGTDVSGTRALANKFVGMYISGSNNLIGGAAPGAGNLLSGNDAGAQIFGNFNRVQGNILGPDVTGTVSLGSRRGLIIFGDSNLIGGTEAGAGNLISGNTEEGLFIEGNGNRLEGNSIGTDVSGTHALGNRTVGVYILRATNNIIGGKAAGAGNLISGNTSHGILMFQGTGNQVQGNYIGTDSTGTRALGNFVGVTIDGGSNNIVGGTAAGAGNLLSGNLAGVLIRGSSGNLVQGNKIGTDVTATAALGNGIDGVEISGGSNNTVGGTAAGAGNLISANREDGVLILPGSSGNLVQGNLIGTDVNGNALGNGSNGVRIFGSNNTIGGTMAGAANTIAYNGRDGVLVDTGTGNAIRRNAIFANGGLGIELIRGGNRMQPAPVLTTATVENGVTTIGGTLTSTPNASFTLEFFVNSACNPSGFGEGEQFFVSVTVTTDADGRASFEFSLNLPVPVDDFITATATDADGNTSMFSRCLQVTGPGG
jgi:titin